MFEQTEIWASYTGSARELTVCNRTNSHSTLLFQLPPLIYPNILVSLKFFLGKTILLVRRQHFHSFSCADGHFLTFNACVGRGLNMRVCVAACHNTYIRNARVA